LRNRDGPHARAPVALQAPRRERWLPAGIPPIFPAGYRAAEDGEWACGRALALEGVLVPVTADWNVQLLQSVGFHHVECYWRHLCFADWITRK
jgi:hypothetical protein